MTKALAKLGFIEEASAEDAFNSKKSQHHIFDIIEKADLESLSFSASE